MRALLSMGPGPLHGSRAREARSWEYGPGNLKTTWNSLLERCGGSCGNGYNCSMRT